MDLHESLSYQTIVSLNITKHLFSKEEFQNKNITFSPLSLLSLVSIITAGSEGSTTKQQLLSFLQSKSTDHLNSFASHLISSLLSNAALLGGPRLSFVNGGWIEQSLPLQRSFQQIVATDYKAALSSVDFQTNVYKNLTPFLIIECNIYTSSYCFLSVAFVKT
jgi:serpin B